MATPIQVGSPMEGLGIKDPHGPVVCVVGGLRGLPLYGLVLVRA